MNPLAVAVRRLAHGADLPLPAYASAQSAGLDLHAALGTAVDLVPGERTLVPTGIAIALPEGYEAQVRARSGLALRHGLGVLNSPGTIDADFRGEVAVILINWGQTTYRIERGMRIAQLVVAPVQRVVWREVDDLSTTGRAQGGFGSTGAARRDERSTKG